MMNPRYLQRFGDPQPFRDSIARAALRYDPDAVYGEPELGDSDGQRLFDPPDFQPSMNKGSLVATPSTAQMAADMTPSVYRPENGEPYTNTGAPWHQGQLPAVPHGDLLVSSSPLDERTNPIPGGAGYNYASEMASSAPMSQPPVTAPPSAPIEHPIVRNQRERAELEAAGGGPAKPESRWPVNDFVTARKPFQPPPTIESNALKSIVSIDDAPEIDSGRLPPPPVIDTRELPTEAPPENPIRRYQRELDALQAPERGPVSKWAKLAAVALGAGQGYYNAANPNARPIDASEAVQNLTLGRKYIDAMGDYQRKRKDIGERMKLAGDAEQVETNRIYRDALAANTGLVNDARNEGLQQRKGQLVAGLSDKGFQFMSKDDKIPDGWVKQPGFDSDGMIMVRNPNYNKVKITAGQAKQFPGTSEGQLVDSKTLEAALLKPAAAGGQIRNMNQSVSIADALANYASGVGVYHKPNGDEYSLPELQALQGNHQGLQGVLRGNQVFYIPFTPQQSVIRFGNEVVAVTKFTTMGANDPLDTGHVVLGQNRTGQTVTSTPTTVQVDKDGVPHILGSTSQTTPNTPGANRTPLTQRPSANDSQPLAVPLSPNRPPAPQLPVVTPQRVSGPQSRMAQGVTLGMHRDLRAAAGPVRAVAAQMFGDPANPTALPSMRKFAYLADDNGARQRIGDALRILLANDDHLVIGSGSQTQGWSSGGNVGSGVMVPVSVGITGGMNRSGTQATPTLNADQVAKINREIAAVVGRLKPGDEREAVIALMKAYEEIGGLRKVFSGSNALAAIAQMQKTLPMIGFNDTLSAAQFHSKLTRTAEDAHNGKFGIPVNYLGDDVVNAIDRERRYVPNSPAGGGRGDGRGGRSTIDPIEQQSPSTGEYRHSFDGGDTWRPGRKP